MMFHKLYKSSMDQIKISKDFKVRTAKLMKDARPVNKLNKIAARRIAVSFACAALVVAAGLYTVNSTMFTKDTSISSDNTNTITVATVKLPSSNSGVKADMVALFVYNGRIYLQSTTSIRSTDGVISKEDMLALRGDYLGTTTGGINELSGKDAYAKDFVSNIGESKIYTIKGYDSKYRLMAYTEYDGGFGCEIYDSFGGLEISKGKDYFGLLHLSDNISSYQWENFDSWNNGKNERKDSENNEAIQEFLKQLNEATPIAESPDMTDKLISDTAANSQKFLYISTKDHLVTTLRLLQDGYVFVPQVGYFQVDKTAFDAFYNSMAE